MVINLDKFATRLEGLAMVRCQGRVVRVTGTTIETQGPPVGVGHLCRVHLADGRSVHAEVVGFHGPRRILLPFEAIDGIAPNDLVSGSPLPREVTLGPQILGRVIDGLCNPLDGKGPLNGSDRRSLDAPAPSPLSRRSITEPLALGIRVLDGLLTVGRGQRMGIFAGSGVGKSTLLGWIARDSDADVNVLALIGERGREVRQFLEESLGPEGLAKSIVVVATADASPVQRVKAAFAAVTIAEYFRDCGKHVLFLMDSITRFCQAQREIGLAAGEPPTTKGYCPSVFAMLPKLTERMGLAENGSITGILSVLVEGDDMNDPVADSARSLLDGHIVLARQLAETGHYPAVDILQSISRLSTAVCTPAHCQAAQRLRAAYATYRGAEDLINIGALVSGHNHRIDRAVSLIERINQFLIQPIEDRTPFSDTVKWVTEIGQAWETLLPGPPETTGKEASV